MSRGLGEHRGPGGPVPCAHCGGSGWVLEDDPAGRSVGWARRCRCRSSPEAVAQHLRAAGMEEPQVRQATGAWDEELNPFPPVAARWVEGQVELQEEALHRRLGRRARQGGFRPLGSVLEGVGAGPQAGSEPRVAPLPRVPPLLYVFGPPGVGKTHLAARCAREYLARRLRPGALDPGPGPLVRWWYVPAAVQRVMAERREGPSRTEGRARTAELLVLDDYGSEAGRRPAHAELVDGLIVERWEAGRGTVVTSNGLPRQREGRLVSRVHGAALVDASEWTDCRAACPP